MKFARRPSNRFSHSQTALLGRWSLADRMHPENHGRDSITQSTKLLQW